MEVEQVHGDKTLVCFLVVVTQEDLLALQRVRLGVWTGESLPDESSMRVNGGRFHT